MSLQEAIKKADKSLDKEGNIINEKEYFEAYEEVIDLLGIKDLQKLVEYLGNEVDVLKKLLHHKHADGKVVVEI